MYEYMNMNMTFFHGAGMLILWMILIFLLLSIFNKKESPNKESPLDILKKRLAKGEITKEQYDSIKETLSHQV